MNTQEYISSGIIESYVLGLASPEERTAFEAMCRQYPEVLKARIAFELALEKQAMENAIAPPVELKGKILEKLELSAGKIVPLQPAPLRNRNWLKYAVAACLVLLAGSLYWNISLYNRNKRLSGEYDNSVAKLNEIENNIRVIQQNPNIKMASMKGLEISPRSFATVYWDTTSKDVYLLVNNLPVPASGKQYQLWALLNGKPIDMGVIEMDDMKTRKTPLLYQMKNAQGAQAFAITLEEKGGSPSPRGDMYVMGNL